jgi:hypothetical protein
LSTNRPPLGYAEALWTTPWRVLSEPPELIRVQHRTDIHLDRWLDPPSGDQFHPVDLVGLARVGHVEPRDQFVPKLRLDLETVRSVRRDHRIDGSREIRRSVPAGEQVDVLARPLKDPVGDSQGRSSAS